MPSLEPPAQILYMFIFRYIDTTACIPRNKQPHAHAVTYTHTGIARTLTAAPACTHAHAQSHTHEDNKAKSADGCACVHAGKQCKSRKRNAGQEA